MPRYRNPQTGVVVDIPESLAASIGTYEPVDAPEPRGATEDSKKPSQRRARGKSDD
jgi:hypothetical protein